MLEQALVPARMDRRFTDPLFIRERLARVPTLLNENGVDQFGFDPKFAAKVAPIFAWIYQNYFRVETHDVNLVPDGRCLIIGNHSGQLPFDAMMINMAVFLERREPRILRAMIEKFVTQLPYVSYIFERCGQIIGTPDNCRRLLTAEEGILVFPEGVRGINKLFHQRYLLQEFGLGFMRLALETGTPIVPVATVGAEEQAPALFNLKSVAKVFGMPTLPIALGLMSILPYPTKYRIYFGEPMHFTGDPNDEDSEIRVKVKQVEDAIRTLLERGLRERKHIFW
jgi:1-acyl-sn-glycerol-3-phosphate acyltransferase